MQNTYLKVDSENRGAVQLYRQMGYREVARVSEELLVPKSPTRYTEYRSYTVLYRIPYTV
jgi:ribosomal protein S18 acetylase RimI-like enzyme